MLSNPELDTIIDVCQTLVGSRLQDVMADEKNLGLGFYHHDRVLWVWFDLSPTNPMMIPLLQAPFKIKKKIPLSLFLHAHFKGHRLLGIQRNLEYGRVVELSFGSEEAPRRLEVRLFRSQVNALAYSEDKKICLRPPKELEKFVADQVERSSRSVDEIVQEWQDRYDYQTSGQQKPKPRATSAEKEKKKLVMAIEKVKQEIEKKRLSPYRKLGEWLVANQSLKVPEDWNLLVDGKKSLSWNIEHAFKQAKSVEAKLAGTEQRLLLLKKNIKNIKKDERVIYIDANKLKVNENIINNIW